MRLKIIGGHGQLPYKEIEALENKIGVELPKEYRKFLAKNNGGSPVPDIFDFFDKNKGSRDASDVGGFLSVGVKEYDSIENYLSVYYGRVPTEYLPVAHDSGGNLILVKLKGMGAGGVYFWDHEYEANMGEVAGDENVYYVSESFDEFLNSLYDIEE